MRVETISRSSGRSEEGWFYIQERSMIKRRRSGGVPTGRKLPMNLLRSKILSACFVLTCKQESK